MCSFCKMSGFTFISSAELPLAALSSFCRRSWACRDKGSFIVALFRMPSSYQRFKSETRWFLWYFYILSFGLYVLLSTVLSTDLVHFGDLAVLWGEAKAFISRLIWLEKKDARLGSPNLFSDLKNNLHACSKSSSYAAVSYHTLFSALKCMNNVFGVMNNK